jgi:hypothetical protein
LMRRKARIARAKRKIKPPMAMPTMAPVDRGLGSEVESMAVGMERVGVRAVIFARRARRTGRSRCAQPADGVLTVAPPCGLDEAN